MIYIFIYSFSISVGSEVTARESREVDASGCDPGGDSHVDGECILFSSAPYVYYGIFPIMLWYTYERTRVSILVSKE